MIKLFQLFIYILFIFISKLLLMFFEGVQRSHQRGQEASRVVQQDLGDLAQHPSRVGGGCRPGGGVNACCGGQSAVVSAWGDERVAELWCAWVIMSPIGSKN